MPNYSSLKLSTGGGLISDIQKAAQRANTATIIIGCGGTGKDALKQLKKSLFARVRQDDSNSPVPTYSHIRFLSIDTDTGNLKQSDSKDKASKTEQDRAQTYISNVTDLDPNTEFFDISCNNIQGKISGYAENAKNGISNPGFEWVKVGNNDILSADAGAGGVRQIGRILLLEKVSAFIGRLTQEINRAIKELSNPRVQFLIFAGIGGGTGSGIFLDVCYLVQYTIKYMALKNSSTQAFVFLPDVNIANVENAHTQEYIRKNGYCAMRELDYCMNLTQSGNYWKQELGGANFEKFYTKPAEIVTLISATNALGASFKDSYKYSMNIAADFSLDLICESNGFDFDSHKSNHYREVDSAVDHSQYGGNYEYSILGAAAVEVPFRKIMTYLASAMYATKFNGLRDRIPTANEYADFEKNVKLNSGSGNQDPQLFKDMCNGEQKFPYIYPDFGNYAEDFTDGKNFPLITTLDRALDGRHGIWEENMKNLTDKLSSYRYDDKPTTSALSIINRVYAWIIDIILDLDKGPYYARELLKGAQGRSLNNSIVNLKEWSLRREGTADKDYECNETSSVTPNKSKFIEKAGKKIGAKDRYKMYASAMVTHYALLDDTGHNENGKNIPGRQSIFRAMLDIISRQVDELSIELEKLCGILDELDSIFTRNYKDLDEGMEFEYIDGSYVTELFKITDDEIRRDMDDTVAKLDGKQQFKSMMIWILNSHSDWHDDNKIASGISSMLKDVFQEYSERSLEVYLHKHYKTNGSPTQLQNCIENILYPDLRDKAYPMFWVTNGFDMTKTGKFGYISAPSSCTALANAATNFKETPAMNGYDVRLSAQEDRIQIQVFASGIPMYAYNGAELYKEDFLPYIGTGKGYSSHEADEDWSEVLPFITPGTKLRTGNSSKRDVSEALRKYSLFMKAMELNILTVGPYDGNKIDEHLYLHFIDFDSLNETLKQWKTDLESNKINAQDVIEIVANAMEDIEDQKEPQPTLASFTKGDKRTFILPQKEVRTIETKCENGHQAEVRFDNFMRFRGFNMAAEQEVHKFEKYVSDLLEFQKKAESKDWEAKIKKIFERTLFTGLFTFNDDLYEKISYTTVDEYGRKDDPVVLSDTNDKFAVVGIYQAYLNFKEQSKDLIENAMTRSDEIYADGGEAICEPLKKIRNTVLSKSQIAYYDKCRQEQAWTVQEKDDVKRFIRELIINFDFVCNRFRVDKDYAKPETPAPEVPAVQSKPAPSGEWKCSSCGTFNSGNFCNNCGNKKPAASFGQWQCVCGTINMGKFCSNCGKGKPVQSEAWDCSCGKKGIVGNFCSECGAKRV